MSRHRHRPETPGRHQFLRASLAVSPRHTWKWRARSQNGRRRTHTVRDVTDGARARYAHRDAHARCRRHHRPVVNCRPCRSSAGGRSGTGGAVHDCDGCLRAMGHTRRRTRALQGVCVLHAGDAQREHPARADHGARHQPQRRPLFLVRAGGGVPGRRAGRHHRDLAALASRRQCKDTLAQRGQLELRRRQLALGRHAASHPDADLVRFRRRTAAQAGEEERRSPTCRRSSWPGTRPAAST